jgi:hypothetical protein
MAEKLDTGGKKGRVKLTIVAPPAQPSPPPPGDNSLSDEDKARALRIVHISRLRAQQIKVDTAKTALEAEQSVMTDLFHRAKADTRYQRKELAELLRDMRKSKEEIQEELKRKAELYADWDIPVVPAGYQMELDFENRMPREAADEQHAKGMGYAAGLRGDPCVMPEGMEVRFGPAFGEGWGKGQEELGWALSAVGRIVDRKPGAAGGPTRAEIERQAENDPRETRPATEFDTEPAA